MTKKRIQWNWPDAGSGDKKNFWKNNPLPWWTQLAIKAATNRLFVQGLMVDDANSALSHGSLCCLVEILWNTGELCPGIREILEPRRARSLKE